MPEGFTEASYLESIASQGGLGVPLNIFLMQVGHFFNHDSVNRYIDPQRCRERSVLICV